MLQKLLIRKLAIILAAAAAAATLSSCSPVKTENVMNNDAELSISSSESSSDEESVPDPEPEPEPEPEPLIYVSTLSPEQGSYMIIRLENVDAEGVSYTDFLGYERSFFPCDGAYYSIIPVKAAAEPGEYVLSFSAGDFEYSESVTVAEREFEKQYLTVSESTLEETLESEAANAEFYQKTGNLKSVFTPTALWNGAFRNPLDAEYKVTTSFGTFRTFSNGATERHNATDMATKGGTPVYATNSGNVLFAEYLQLTGNTVVIDHGLGVLSWHYHMRSISVSSGQFVEKGELIGEVGTTGLSTGNHLHFGVTVGGIFTDPMALIGTEPDLDFWKAEK